jgi:hypothetical protein
VARVRMERSLDGIYYLRVLISTNLRKLPNSSHKRFQKHAARCDNHKVFQKNFGCPVNPFLHGRIIPCKIWLLHLLADISADLPKMFAICS